MVYPSVLILAIFCGISQLPIAKSYGYPGYGPLVLTIKRGIEKSVETDIILLVINGHETPFSREELCKTLSDLHNRNDVTGANFGAEGHNRPFLALRNPGDKYGFYAVSQLQCMASLANPTSHQYADWLIDYSGVHVGKWYGMDGSVSEDILEWMALDRHWLQHIHYISRCEQRRCDCAKVDPRTGNDCSWSWNYPGRNGRLPYVYRWDPINEERGNGSKGAFLGYSYPLASVGFRKAECIIWIGLENVCMQCFSKYSRPIRVTLACLNGFGQYEILDDLPKRLRDDGIETNEV